LIDPESTCRGKIPVINARTKLCHVDRCNGVVEAAPRRKSSACRKRVSDSTAQLVRPGGIQVFGVRSSLQFVGEGKSETCVTVSISSCVERQSVREGGSIPQSKEPSILDTWQVILIVDGLRCHPCLQNLSACSSCPPCLPVFLSSVSSCLPCLPV
jgi:hypothetical protein